MKRKRESRMDCSGGWGMRAATAAEAAKEGRRLERGSRPED
jgi:hypothetical protein